MISQKIMIDKAVVEQALDSLESIALAGMSGSGQESEEGMREWHARQAWKFIGIAAQALSPLREALAQPQQPLSEEEIQQLKLDCGYDYYSSYEVSAAFIHGVKECEAAHGIVKGNQ